MDRRRLLTATAALGAGLIIGRSTSAAAQDRSSEPHDALMARWYNEHRRFAALNQGRIAYVEQGAGDAALFLHGFPLSGFQWRGALDRLSPHRRCIAPDFLGLGFTEVAKGQGVTPMDQVRMLAELLDKLSVGAVDLVANDSGGAVAQLFVTRYPERVRTMLLTNCDVETDSPPPALLPIIQLARQGTYPDKLIVPWVRDKSLARAADGLGGACYVDPGRPTDAAIDQYLAPLAASPARKAVTNAFTLGLTPNPLAGIEAKLKQCAVPTRIVWGMSDKIFSPKNPAYLDALLPNSRGVRRIAEAKLFFPEEYPDLIAEEAQRLWQAD